MIELEGVDNEESCMCVANSETGRGNIDDEGKTLITVKLEAINEWRNNNIDDSETGNNNWRRNNNIDDSQSESNNIDNEWRNNNIDDSETGNIDTHVDNTEKESGNIDDEGTDTSSETGTSDVEDVGTSTCIDDSENWKW